MSKGNFKNWKEVTISEINFRISKNIDPSNYQNQKFELYSIPSFETGAPEIVEGSTIKSSKQVVSENDILISKINPKINRVWKVQNFSEYLKIASSEWIVITTGKNIIPDFLRYQFSAPAFRNLLQSEVSGVGGSLTRARPKIVENYKVGVCPIDEQTRIVERLDDFFKSIDKIGECWKTIDALYWKIVEKSLIDPSTNNYFSSKKLESFLEERSSRIGRFWHGVRKVGVSAKKGIIDLDTGQKKSFENYKVVKPGDFVYNAMRINIGSIAQYQGTEEAITSPDYIVFRVKNHLSSNLLLGFLKSEMGLKEINANTKGSVRSRLYFKDLININLPISPIETQTEAEHILQWLTNSVLKVQNSLELKREELTAHMLDQAFQGRSNLEQNPN